jgi:hypothetical protein
MEIIEASKTLLEIVALLAAIFYVYLSWQLTPSLKLRILPRWIDKTRVILRIEIENASRLRVKKEQIMFQILEYPENQTTLSEWAPFTIGDLVKGQEPSRWKDPTEIFNTTVHFFANEILSTEILYTLEDQSAILHVALQFRSKPPLSWLRLNIFGHKEQWTATVILKRDNDKI